MGEYIYNGMDQQNLDNAYNPSANIVNAAELQEKRKSSSSEARAEFRCSLDIPYGASPGETLDIFYAPETNGPINVFFHGGSWRAQDKSNYSFLARLFVDNGVNFIVVNFDLCPHVSLDELIRQCRAAVAWTYQHARIMGGDPSRITISGHSSGAHIVSRVLETDWCDFDNVPGSVVKGALGLAGIYDLEPIRLTSLNRELGFDQEAAQRHTTIDRMPRSAIPYVLAVGSADTSEFRQQTKDFHSALMQNGFAARLIEVPGDNHFTILETLANSNKPLGQAALRLTRCADCGEDVSTPAG